MASKNKDHRRSSGMKNAFLAKSRDREAPPAARILLGYPPGYPSCDPMRGSIPIPEQRNLRGRLRCIRSPAARRRCGGMNTKQQRLRAGYARHSNRSPEPTASGFERNEARKPAITARARRAGRAIAARARSARRHGRSFSADSKACIVIRAASALSLASLRAWLRCKNSVVARRSSRLVCL